MPFALKSKDKANPSPLLCPCSYATVARRFKRRRFATKRRRFSRSRRLHFKRRRAPWRKRFRTHRRYRRYTRRFQRRRFSRRRIFGALRRTKGAVNPSFRHTLSLAQYRSLRRPSYSSSALAKTTRRGERSPYPYGPSPLSRAASWAWGKVKSVPSSTWRSGFTAVHRGVCAAAPHFPGNPIATFYRNAFC